MDQIKAMISEGSDVTKKCEEFAPKIARAVELIVEALQNGKKVLLAGNGGSAEMSAHIAAEFTGRYKLERKPLAAIALTTDLAAITAIGNDYGFENIFSRQLEALGNQGDVFISLSTSGNSKNLANAMESAKKKGLRTVAFLGKDGGMLKNKSDIELIVPSNNTPRIQEAHLMMLHVICEMLENKLFM